MSWRKRFQCGRVKQCEYDLSTTSETTASATTLTPLPLYRSTRVNCVRYTSVTTPTQRPRPEKLKSVRGRGERSAANFWVIINTSGVNPWQLIHVVSVVSTERLLWCYMIFLVFYCGHNEVILRDGAMQLSFSYKLTEIHPWHVRNAMLWSCSLTHHEWPVYFVVPWQMAWLSLTAVCWRCQDTATFSRPQEKNYFV